MFNTEAHPVDASALYCCSAEKQRHIGEIEDLHNNIDLLALMGIYDIEELYTESEPKERWEPPQMTPRSKTSAESKVAASEEIVEVVKRDAPIDDTPAQQPEGRNLCRTLLYYQRLIQTAL